MYNILIICTPYYITLHDCTHITLHYTYNITCTHITLHIHHITLPVLPPSSSPYTCLPWSVSTCRSGSPPPPGAGCNTSRSDE